MYGSIIDNTDGSQIYRNLSTIKDAAKLATITASDGKSHLLYYKLREVNMKTGKFEPYAFPY